MKLLWASACLAALLAGCQAGGTGASSGASAANAATPIVESRAGLAARQRLTCGPSRSAPGAGFQGRTITVRSLADITLNDREVVLTFDDGPIPRKTRSILDTL
ncbi:MAG: hypothetical protein AAGF49_16815, partial [Pseudomonadota bacterium]